MNISHLKCFECVYENHSINKAAGKLYMTPQGVGKNIQYLENELDTTLFDRTRNGVHPTESAHLLHKQAESIIRQLEELKASIAQLNRRHLTLRIGYSSGVFNVLPFDAILKFMEQNPEIEVTWNEYINMQMHELLLGSEIEYCFGVGLKRVPFENIITRTISRESAVLLVYEGHPLYHAETVSVDKIRNERILTLGYDFFIYHKFLDLCDHQGFIPKIVAKTSDCNVLFSLCFQHIGLAVVPDYNCKNLQFKGLRAVPFREDFDLLLHTAYKKGNENIEVIKKFDDFIRKYI